MKEIDADFEALKALTRLAWELNFEPATKALKPEMPVRPTDA